LYFFFFLFFTISLETTNYPARPAFDPFDFLFLANAGRVVCNPEKENRKKKNKRIWELEGDRRMLFLLLNERCAPGLFTLVFIINTSAARTTGQ